MSYEIVYEKQFLKTNDSKIIPLVLIGSNNYYEPVSRCRERRVRNWSSIISDSNKNIAFSEKEIRETINNWLGGYGEHFKFNSKWVDDAGLLRFVNNSIKGSKTIEELNELSLFPISLTGYFSVWYTDGETYSDGSLKQKNKNEQKEYIHNSDELEQFLKAADNRIRIKTATENIYICLNFNGDKAIPYPKKRKDKANKPPLSRFYTIKVFSSRIYFLRQLTAKHIKGCYEIENAKQFMSAREAEKWAEKYNIKNRFGINYEIEFCAKNSKFKTSMI